MIKEIIIAHLIGLQTNFNVRFEDFPEENLGWIKKSISF
jgi:hypothetical protein